MTFADQLNSKANEYNNRMPDSPNVPDFISNKVNQYTQDIESLCRYEAEKGKHRIQGFFVPSSYHYYDEVSSTRGLKILDFPKNIINKKPSYYERYDSLSGGAADVSDAIITLVDGLSLPKGLVVDSSMIEKVRLDLVRALNNHGFKKLDIIHLIGPKYERGKILFSTAAVRNGDAHYFYVDIEW